MEILNCLIDQQSKLLTWVKFIALKQIQIGFSKDSSVPEGGKVVIENKLLANSVLESIIGKNGVSPPAKESLASRLSPLFNDCGVDSEKTQS